MVTQDPALSTNLGTNFTSMFGGGLFSPTEAVIKTENLDGTMTRILAERPDEFPLLRNLTRTVTNAAVYQYNRRLDRPTASDVVPVGKVAAYERHVEFIRHLDYRTGISHASLNLINARRAETGKPSLSYQELLDREPAAGVLGLLRRIEWALLHADGDSYNEGGVEQDVRTIYRGLMAMATPIETYVTTQMRAMLSAELSLLNTVVAAALRVKGILRSFDNVVVLVPPWYTERVHRGVFLTNFGPLTVLACPHLHADMLALSADPRDVVFAQLTPALRWPLAPISTTVESLYILHHTPVIKAPERVIAIPLLPPSDVPVPDFVPPPYHQNVLDMDFWKD